MDDPTMLLSLEQACFGYGAQDVLVDIDLPVTAGSFIGVVGPSGSGKSSLLQLMAGSVRPRSGAVHRQPDLRTAFVPQTEHIDWSFPITVAQCAIMARVGVRRWPWASRSERREVAAMLDRLGLDGLAERHIRELSGGQQQRVFIARALLSDPQILLMDEPTAGLDVRVRHDVFHVLADLHADGMTIVLTTHDLNGVAAHLPHLVCLNGRVIGAGSPMEVLTPDVLELTYGAPMEVLEHAGMPVVVEMGAHA